MDLEVSHPYEEKRLLGSGSFEASSGQSLRIETSPEGEEILDVSVPEGKVWQVMIGVVVKETDA